MHDVRGRGVARWRGGLLSAGVVVYVFLQRLGPLGGSVAVSVAGWSAGMLAGWLVDRLAHSAGDGR